VNLARTLLSPKPPSKRVLGQAPRLPISEGWWPTRAARSRLAALRQAIECSTRLDHVENGPPLHRQVRRVEVQTRGRLYVFKGKQLPEFIGVCTGEGYKGKHLAQVLLSHDSVPNVVQEQPFGPTTSGAWPELRDVVHMGLGLTGFLLLRFFLNLIAGMT